MARATPLKDDREHFMWHKQRVFDELNRMNFHKPPSLSPKSRDLALNLEETIKEAQKNIDRSQAKLAKFIMMMLHMSLRNI